MSERKAEVIGPDHTISRLANSLSAETERITNAASISPWEFTVALANACGQILAKYKDMPRDTALERMDSLREVMVGAYDLYDVEGGEQ